MKKIAVISIILIFIGQNAFSFWIWSPKTQKWKNPEYSAKANPQNQLKEALMFFDKKQYKRSLKEFKKIIKAYADAKEASEGQYFIARCYEELDQLYKAHLEYQKVVSMYPNSVRIQEAIKRSYDLGESLLTWSPKRFLGVPMTVLEDHPSIEIFKKIVEVAPYSEYAPKALHEMGVLLLDKKRFEEAKVTFEQLIDQYPEDELSSGAKYKLALATSETSLNPDYDQSATKEATQRMKDFIGQYSSSDTAIEAEKQLSSLKAKEAEKNFDTAQFYEKQGKSKSALIYYKLVFSGNPKSLLAKAAKEKIELLRGEME